MLFFFFLSSVSTYIAYYSETLQFLIVLPYYCLEYMSTLFPFGREIPAGHWLSTTTGDGYYQVLRQQALAVPLTINQGFITKSQSLQAGWLPMLGHNEIIMNCKYKLRFLLAIYFAACQICEKVVIMVHLSFLNSSYPQLFSSDFWW